MSITNKKIDALRRLLLGNLYQECKDNPMGVSRERLEQHLEKIKGEGCIGDCSVEEFVKTCQLKTHYPTCVSADYRGCIEGIGERSKGVDKFYYDQYKTSKMFENEPDTDEEEEEGEVCNVCGLTGDDNIGLPVQEMSCGHHSHVNCLIRVAQQKGRDNAECPECRKEFPLTEVPVPIRTLEQRQADSARRYEFNASQMGINIRGEEDEQTEEDRLSVLIGSHIEDNDIERAIRGIRDLYTRDVYRRTMTEYIRTWFRSLITLLEDGENIDINQFKSLMDTIFNINFSIISFNNRTIKSLTQIYNRGNAVIKEAVLYIIKTISKHYIVDRREDDNLRFFIEILMGNSSVELIEEVMRVAEDNNANESLRDSINNNIEDIDLDRVKDDIKNLIEDWFRRHNYEVPNLSRENVERQLSEAIVEYIRTHYFMGAEVAIEEFYERNFEDTYEYRHSWFNELLNQIETGELEIDNVVSLLDIMITKDNLINLNRRIIKKLRNIMRLGGPQREQCIYIVMKISTILITELSEEEDLGILLENIIKEKTLTLLKVIMKVADENNGVEILKTHLLDVTDDINDSQTKNVINRWFTSHNLPLPIYQEESYEEPPHLTPPHERVRRGGWFGKFRR